MITRFSAENIGCFDSVSVDLEPLTVFAGPNASGKSTVLRAMRTLAILTRASLNFGQRGVMTLAGFTPMTDFFRDPAKDMKLAVQARSPLGAGSYSVVLGYDDVRNRVEVREEAAKWKDVGGHPFTYDSNTKPLDLEYRGIKLDSVPRDSALPFLAYEHYRRDKTWSRKLKPLYDLVDAFSPMRVYRFSPGAIALPADPTEDVGYDGGGLAADMDRLLGSARSTYDQIVQELRGTFAHIQNVHIRTIVTKPTARKMLEFEVGGGRRVPAAFESDGVLLTLAHLWLAYRSKDPVVGLEEPESATYPSLVTGKVRLLESMADGTATGQPVQIIVTSHSPRLLTALGDTEKLRVFEGGKVYSPPEQHMADVIYTRLAWVLEQ